MVRHSDDKVPLTHSPSITQETKARFNELLNAALSKEASTQPQVFKISSDFKSTRQSDGVPKIIPRQKKRVKSPVEDTKVRNVSKVYSSEESSDSRRRNERQVIADVHSSHTHLLPSSSDDDILSEKKEKRKRKKSRGKQPTESTQLMKEGRENLSFHVNEENLEMSPSRLSSRSYVIETPLKDMKLLDDKTQDDFSKVLDNKHNFNSPSRISNRSYTLEISTFPVESINKDEPVLPKVKTPIPLPRRKSLTQTTESVVKADKLTQQRRESVKIDVEHVRSGAATPVQALRSPSQTTEDDRESLRTAAAQLQANSLYTEEEGDIALFVQKQIRKKKRRKHSKSRESMELQEFQGEILKKNSLIEVNPTIHSVRREEAIDNEKEGKPARKTSVDQIVGVTIHGVDCPLVDLLVRHPVVRLYIVDTSTGELCSKSDPSRSVSYYGENTTYVPPIMTHPFDFYQHRSVMPQWEECLQLNDSFSHLLTTSTMLLFEVSDFVSAALASARHSRLGSAAAWHIVAWAFLRPVVTGGLLNTGQRLRLQLYKPGKRPKNTRPLTPLVYEWWGSATRHKYPGCLFVTVASLNAPTTPLSPRLRSRHSLQAEQGSVASVRSASAAGSGANSEENFQDQEEGKVEAVAWSRLTAQSCKLPNTRLRSLPVNGSMCLQFSPDGLWLACARQDICIYSVPQFQHTATLSGHQGLVYCLRWSADSKVLLSASADCTVCVWRPNYRKTPLLQMLGHPSFVYCAQFVLTPGYCTLVSGCCDGMVRVWQGETHSSYQLIQELCGHAGYVTSICATVDSTRVLSADNLGSVRIYDVEEDGSLSGGRELRVREVRGTVISNLLPHPGGHRLLVHSRDSTLRTVDVDTGAALQTFKGCVNTKVQTGVCVSACGGLVFACGEDGSVAVWSGHTGALRAVYLGLLPPGSAAVHYHPHEHMLAVAALAQPPVYILTFHKDASGEDIGLNVIRSEVSAADVVEKMKLIHNSNKWQKAALKVLSDPPHSRPTQDKSVKEMKKAHVEKQDKTTGKQPQNGIWPSLHKLGYHVEKSPGSKDLRLLEIIEKMDSIILAAKKTSQSS